MKARTYRPRINNGQVARRRVQPSVSKASGRKARTRYGARRRSRTRRARNQGANVLWMLVFIGALVATGFVIALRLQINVHQLGLAEAQLKAELDEITNRQRYEVLQQQRAFSTRESDRTARQAGLIQPKLNQLNSQLDVMIKQQAVSRNQTEQAVKPKKESNNQRPSSRSVLRR